MYRLAIATLLANNYLLFALGATLWFVLDRPSVSRLSGLVGTITASGWFHLWSLRNVEITLTSALGSAAILLLSQIIFTYNIMTSRRLTGAYSTDTPTFLNQTGMYQWIRHPFYTAYLLTLSVPVMLNPTYLLLIHFALIALTYDRTARGEESKFLVSPLAEQYRTYMAVTARFIPGVY